MKVSLALAGAAVLAAVLPGTVLAGWRGEPAYMRPPHGLPPISGTIRVHPDRFGHAHYEQQHAGSGFRPARRWSGNDGESSFGEASRPRFSYGVPFRTRGPAYGYQGHAYEQLAFGNAGSGYAYRSRPRAQGWRGDGTGLVGLIGGSGDESYGGAATGWGTADSATTGGAYPVESASYGGGRPLASSYGEPDLWSGGGAPAYPPTGGLGYYSSGSPGQLAYYSSGSSAGPYGSPGGLSVYSSGSYGAGPAIIEVPHRRYGGVESRPRCGCGPRIIYRERHRNYANW